MTQTFKLDQRVHWFSRGGSSYCTKEGVIEYVVAASQILPRELAREADAYGLPRDHESYLVRVGKSDKRKGKLYWPRVKDLKAGPVSQESNPSTPTNTLLALHVTEYKSVGELKSISTMVRVFVDRDYHYGYFVDEHALFALLSPEQQSIYLQGSEAKLQVSTQLAQQIIDMGETPCAKRRVHPAS